MYRSFPKEIEIRSNGMNRILTIFKVIQANSWNNSTEGDIRDYSINLTTFFDEFSLEDLVK